jgi:MoaA/NifB/PqqE/SkfB family radical SAM enzyme
MRLDILYRGPLASCNYGCEYCPFAKRKDTREQLATDREQWERFVDAIEDRTDVETGILVTPWGEALIRRWYQDGMARLSHMPHVTRIAAQTNLSCELGWLANVNAERLALWCTYHPEWTTLDEFVAQTAKLDAAGVQYSVGVVGQREYADAALALRAALPESTYLWINAVKALEYTAEEIAGWTAIDPLFRINVQRWPSFGAACGAGERAITVDGDGVMRRCHFIKDAIGNFYADDWRDSLKPRPCTNVDCHCHIGYVHLDYLELHKVFATGLLERVPVPEARAAKGLHLPIVH